MNTTTTTTGFVDLRDLDLNIPGRNLIIVTTIFSFFDFIFIGVRLYARRIKKRYLDASDYAILIGFVVSIAGYVLQIIQVVHAGLGLHPLWIIQYLGPDRFRFLGKCVFASNVMFNVCAGAIKISILLLYLSIFDSVILLRRTSWVLIWVVVAMHAGTIVELFLMCRPLAFFWDLGLSIQGTCGSAKDGELAKLIPGVLGVAMDFIIFILPIPVLWTLQMPTKKKIATTAVFGVAFGVVVVSAVRLSYIFQLDGSLKFAITGCIEPGVGIIVACAPMVKPVVEHISGGKFIMWATRSKNSQSSSSGNKYNVSWPHNSNRTYVSGKSDPSKSIEDGDIPLIRVHTPDDERNWMSAAEEGRIRITRDIVVEARPQNSPHAR